MAKIGSFLFIALVAVLMIFGIAFRDWPPSANATTVTFDTYTTGSVITPTVLNTNILARIKTAIDALNTTDSAKLTSTIFTSYTAIDRLMSSTFTTYTGIDRLEKSTFISYTGNDRVMYSVFNPYTTSVATRNALKLATATFNPYTTTVNARLGVRVLTTTFNPYTTNAASRFKTKATFNTYSANEVTRNALKANAASPALTGTGTFVNFSGTGYIKVLNGNLVVKGIDNVWYRLKVATAGFGKISTVAY